MVHVTESSSCNENPEEARKMMRDMMGPGHVDQSIRMAIQHCWMMLPDEKKNAAGLETEIRRLVDRALKDFKEDAQAFAIKLGDAP
jgi:hypothetical protein